MDQVLPMVESNLGIGFYSERIASLAIADGNVTQIRLVEPVPERAVSLIEDLSHPQSIAMRALKKMLLTPEEPFQSLRSI